MPWPSISKACGIFAWLVKLNVTSPEGAVSLVVVNLRAPPGSAATATDLPPLELAVVLLSEDEPPQAAINSPATRAPARVLLNILVKPPAWLGAGPRAVRR